MTRGGKRHQVSKADAADYLTKARGWLDAASESLVAERWDVAAGSAVVAVINASDVICGRLLGEHSGAGNHDDAVGLLAIAGDGGKSASHQLAQLLRFKTPAQYDPQTTRGASRKSGNLGPLLMAPALPTYAPEVACRNEGRAGGCPRRRRGSR